VSIENSRHKNSPRVAVSAIQFRLHQLKDWLGLIRPCSEETVAGLPRQEQKHSLVTTVAPYDAAG
jgi:hypothetical protein